MKGVIEQYISKFKEDRKNHKRMISILLVLSLLVTLGVFWQLKLTGITLSDEALCGIEEHSHTDVCCEKRLICEIDEDAATEDGVLGHVHTDQCYEIVYICGKEEHIHEPSCYSDANADIETYKDWESTFADVRLTGNYVDDLIAIAETQIGYTESIKNFVIDENGERCGYTRYGQWYGNPYGEWSAMFVAFCLNYSGVTQEVIPYNSGCRAWAAELSNLGMYESAADHTPEKGDLIFFDIRGTEDINHVGIVTKFENDKINTIEGNVDGVVVSSSYEPKDIRILGYTNIEVLQEKCASHPDNDEIDLKSPDEDSDITEKTDEQGNTSTSQPPEATDNGNEITSSFYYEDEEIALTFYVEGNATLPENLSPDEGLPQDAHQGGSLLEKAHLSVTPLDESSDAYWRLADFVQENGGEDELFALSALEYHFYYNDIELDTSQCDITAEINLKDQMLTPPATTYAMLEDESVSEEAEIGIVVSVLEESNKEVTELENVFLESDCTLLPALTVPVNSDGILAITASQTANPKFTVQYYAYIDQVATSGSNPLDVIDTSGGILPKNGVTPSAKEIYLEPVGGGKHKVATTQVLTEIYKYKNYEYITAPNLSYFNRLYENGNYELLEIWIMKEGATPSSTNPNDWIIHDNPSEIHFTNRESSQNDTTLLINEGTVIRLVFDTTDSKYNNEVAFYDYDITDGKLYQKADTSSDTYSSQPNDKVVYGYTKEAGINNNDNYVGSGSKLAFGNMNTATGLFDVTWDGNSLNKANSNGYKKCTFGLVTGLDDNGNIQYSTGVIAPNLFNNGTALGKTTFNNYSLEFNRDGDTYTLSAVNGTDTKYLEYFNNPDVYDIWTNNFWPMDCVDTAGHDLRFGDKTILGNRKYFGNKTYNFPRSDDGLDHNSYFGMQYSVSFTLTEDYIGPLEYYFFGDDDMWVFLDGKLVCDIGGVHSSVGEYVNLWDYIDKGDSGTHTLSFFYTERGASGSSCYMRFTLPSVSSVTPEQNTGTLRIEKEVVGPSSTDKEFNFNIHFTDKNGNYLPDDYSYTRYDKDGNIVKKDIIIFDGGAFQLKDGEYVIINYLPIGTKYSISEEVIDGYSTTVSINNSDPINRYEAAGNIQLQTQDIVKYVNTTYYELPETGGIGTLFYTFGGLLIMALSLIYGYSLKYKQERRT